MFNFHTHTHTHTYIYICIYIYIYREREGGTVLVLNSKKSIKQSKAKLLTFCTKNFGVF